MKRFLSSFVIAILALSFGACGSGPLDLEENESSVSTNVADGATDVDTNSAFTLTFSAAAHSESVTASTFFVVPVLSNASIDVTASLSGMALVDTATCNPANAITGTIAASVEGTCATTFTLTPSASLDADTEYALCTTTGISLCDPDRYGFFTGFMKTFTTSGSTTDYSVGGTVSGLSGTVVLQNNAADNLTITATGAFTFDTELANGAAYAVTVLTQPTGQTCAVSAGSGTLNAANVTSVSVSCIETLAPTADTTTPSDSATSVSASTTIAVTFSEAMNTTTLTTNTSDTSCSGSLQVSSDSFTTCVRMTAAPTASNSDMTFTVTPNTSLSGSTTYLIRVTTTATDSAGNALASTFTTGTGFTIATPTVYLFKTDAHNGGAGGRVGADSLCQTKMTDSYSTLGCSSVRAFLSVDDSDEIQDMPTNYSVPTSYVIKSPDGTQIADDWADLLDGSIDNSLDTAGLGSTLYHWTGSSSDGSIRSGLCEGWTTGTGGTRGDVGRKSSTDGTWLIYTFFECNTALPAFLCVCW